MTLTGTRIRMEPMTIDHVDDLYEQSDPEGLKYMLFWGPDFGTYEEFREKAQNNIANRAYVTFALIDLASGKAIGASSYMDLRLEHKSFEIGATWIGPAYRGTHVNPEMKYLMLRHAFEELGCVRVQLKTDGRNLRSQRAMEKLGCQKEGVLRRHILLPTGYLRDTVMYSIIAEEWPAVKAGLEARLGYVPGSLANRA